MVLADSKAEGWGGVRRMRTRKRKSIQGAIVAEHITPGKISTVQPKETLLKAETKTLTG